MGTTRATTRRGGDHGGAQALPRPLRSLLLVLTCATLALAPLAPAMADFDVPPSAETVSQEITLDELESLLQAPPAAPLPPPVKLADVEWAGLMWGSDDGYRPAPILAAEVEMRVSGLVARTRLTQRFENASTQWMEGVYLFPLPDDAAVDQLRLMIGDRVLVGEIQEKEEARRTYEAAKVEGKKATLVEQHRPNVFTTRVANVAPGESVEVVLEMQQTVRWDAGEMSLRFPTVVNPRFFAGATPDDAPTSRLDPPLLASAAQSLPPAHAAQVSACGGVPLEHAVHRTVGDAAGHLAIATVGLGAGLVAGLGASFDEWLGPEPPVNPVSFRVLLDSGFPLEYLDAPYHAVDVEVLPGGASEGGAERPRYEVRLAAGAPVEADRDFELVWAPRRGDEPRAAVFSEEYRGDTYTLLMVLPPDGAEAGQAWRSLDRELIFVLDVSGSMHGAALEQAKLALNTVLDGLGPGDSFNVIAFSDRARALYPDSLPATAESVGKARGWVEALAADGGTQMLPALAAALEDDGRYARTGGRTVKQVIFLTDGAVGDAADLFRYIADHLGETRLFTVGIGAAPNAHFMRRAAEEGRGSYTFIGDPAEVALKVEGLARKLESPILTGLEARWDDPTAETWPRRLGDLYAGEPLVVASRSVTGSGSVELVGRTGGELWSRRVDLRGAPAAEARAGIRPASDRRGGDSIRVASLAAGGGPTAGVRQLWARRQIAALEASLIDGADPTVVRSQVIEVAMDHHLVSTYTSLVAVDRTPSRPDGESLLGQRAPLATPAGWTAPGVLPVGGTAWPFRLAAGLALLAFALGVLTLLRRSGVLSAPVSVADTVSGSSR